MRKNNRNGKSEKLKQLSASQIGLVKYENSKGPARTRKGADRNFDHSGTD